MEVLIVDDSLDKLSNIVSCLTKVKKHITINTAQDIRSTYLFLRDNTVDLLIIDLFLPDRIIEGNIKNDGGEEIVNEICRYTSRLCVPKYIIGITQQEQVLNNLLNDVWPIIHYRIGNRWDEKLTKMVRHVDHIVNLQNNIEIKPTVFVEGTSDELFLNNALKLFFPELEGKFIFKSQSNAGANWVAQQLVIWGHQLHTIEGEYIIGIGLLDSDIAGNEARININSKISSANQKIACKVAQLNAKYSKNLINFFSKGIKIEIEIESLFPQDILLYADEQGWLENRNPVLLDTPKDWNQMSQTLNDFLISKGIKEEDFVYLKKIKMAKKESFSKYILDNHKDNKNTFSNFKHVIADISKLMNL